MGCCRKLISVSLYLAVPLAAVLAYFHLECQREAEAKKEATTFKDFNPDVTEVENYPLNFYKLGFEDEVFIGVEYILDQFIPCCVIKLINYVTGHKSVYDVSWQEEHRNEAHNVTFHDARKTPAGSFKESGFTLITLDSEPLTTDWRTNTMVDEGADVTKFFSQMEPHVKDLYPEAKRLVWTFNVVRGGGKFMDQPKAVDGPHLDYHQSLEARIEFHKEFPTIQVLNISEPNILMGALDTEESKFGVMLGIWKPLTDAVCDNPLAIMDARTFDPEHQTINKLHLNFIYFIFHNLNGGIAYSPRQRWYYYPFQSTREVVVFHQYSAGRFFANPHTSFNNRNCPQGSVPRVSVEIRLALFF